MAERKSLIIDAVRSPIGEKRGIMAGNVRADDLAAQVMSQLMDRNAGVSRDDVEDVVMGCAFPEGSQGMLIARSAAVLAGITINSGAKVVNRFCGSSMDGFHQISQAIEAGDIDVGIAAGVEDMFSVPMGGFNPDFHPELAEQEYYIGMGETAENLAQELSISREDQEDFAINSHKKALKAQSEGRFDNEITPITVNGEAVNKDEGPREPNVEKIKSLNPAFDVNGTITPATSSPISIGASMIAISNEEKAHKLGLKPKFRILSRAIAGVDWKIMGSGPLPATEKALKKCGMDMKDIDVIELNEAFAAQSLACISELGIDMSKLNVHGGAIAMGHPLGASGARITGKAAALLNVSNKKYALSTMCVGGGQGCATVLERG